MSLGTTTVRNAIIIFALVMWANVLLVTKISMTGQMRMKNLCSKKPLPQEIEEGIAMKQCATKGTHFEECMPLIQKNFVIDYFNLSGIWLRGIFPIPSF